MVEYKVRFLPGAAETIEKLDENIGQRILDKIHWAAGNFENITPDALTGELKGFYKLRVGDWRVIYTASRAEKTLTIRLIGHRREIYKT